MPKPLLTGLTILVALLLQLAPTVAWSAETALIAIIIDDIGNSRIRGMRAINLPANLTYAVIPNTTHAHALARYAHRAGKEVIVHLPMENTHQRPMGPVALTTDLSQQDFFDVFETAIRSVPYAQGINNHMGSALTQEPVAMTWLMQAIKKHQLFFVDSRTTPKSVASKIAIQQSVRTASRDVFLDNDRTSYAIDRQFRYLLLLAKRNKSAIAIGHPYAETLEYLERAIPILSAENISIVPVSKIISTRLARRQLAANFTASE